MSKNILTIGIVLAAALAASACLELETNLEEAAPVATTPAVATSTDETAANATGAGNRIEKTLVVATPAWEPRPVEADAVPVHNLSVTALSNTSVDEENPVWSPDGSEIALVFQPDSGNRDIYVLDVPAVSAIAGVVNE